MESGRANGRQLFQRLRLEFRRPSRRRLDVFSRVIEKSALYAKVLLEDIFERMVDDGLMQGADVINLISDTGKHFRARLIIGALAKRWPENGAIISP